MGRRTFIPLVTLVVGGGLGFAACWFTRPAPAAVKEDPQPGDEVVVEVRVKLPPGAVQSVGAHHSASSLQQNALLNTSQPYDLAIEGQGFFQVQLPNGDTVYTRDGVFGLNTDGNLVTKQGYRLSPQITIPQEAVSVAVETNGTVSIANPRGLVSVVGQIALVRFNNPGWLRRDVQGWWVETDESGPPHTGEPGENNLGLIRQGFRERQASLDAVTLTDLVREIVREEHVRVRVER